MVWSDSDKRIYFSTFGEPLVYNTESDTPETYSVIVTSLETVYTGELPQHKGVVLTFLTTLLLKPKVKVMLRNMDLIITTFESQADGLFQARCSSY